MAVFTWAFVVLGVSLAAQALQTPRFAPPRLVSAALPPLPGPNVIGGGEVLIEALIDHRGTVTRPTVLRSTPPYTQFVLYAVARWQFEPARDIDTTGVETAVENPITVVAIYRPPILVNAPTIGEPPREVMKASADVAMATSTVSPLYPPNARDGGVVVVEVALDETGRVTAFRDVQSTGGFESTARDALAQFRFRPGAYKGRPVPSTTYVLFGFRTPVGLGTLPPGPRAGWLRPTSVVSFHR